MYKVVYSCPTTHTARRHSRRRHLKVPSRPGLGAGGRRSRKHQGRGESSSSSPAAAISAASLQSAQLFRLLRVPEKSSSSSCPPVTSPRTTARHYLRMIGISNHLMRRENKVNYVPQAQIEEVTVQGRSGDRGDCGYCRRSRCCAQAGRLAGRANVWRLLANARAAAAAAAAAADQVSLRLHS